MAMPVYIGSAVLNGPLGAKDTPEQHKPQPLYGVPTPLAMLIDADDEEQARDKQILWHAIQDRIAMLKQQEVLACYAEAAKQSLARLQRLAESVLR
jgi:hypothetical protein